MASSHGEEIQNRDKVGKSERAAERKNFFGKKTMTVRIIERLSDSIPKIMKRAEERHSPSFCRGGNSGQVRLTTARDPPTGRDHTQLVGEIKRT